MHVSAAAAEAVVVAVVEGEGVMGKAGCQIKVRWVKSFMLKVYKITKKQKQNVM